MRPYDSLTAEEKIAVDESYRTLAVSLRAYRTGIAGDDRAERVIDAISTGIIESRDFLNRKKIEATVV